jgi:aryl-alcohol dehydrogenase-like predicted oxidoreductase
MQYRKLGRTGLNVSEIGYGAWGISGAQWIGAQDEESVRALKAAHEAGVNFFDTALAYGDGHSEQLISRAFGKSGDVIIASKVPPKNYIWPAEQGSKLHDVFPREYVLAALDQSLKNLGREQVDVYQFHVWNDDWANIDEWLETARAMRDSGKARFVGISINDHQPANVLKALETGLVDVVQVIYNIFDQSPEDELFPYCRKNNIGVIARVPFDEGSLTGKIRPETKFAADDFRNEYFQGDRKQEVWDRVQQIAADAVISVDQMPELALQFCLSDPAVSTVIPGMRNPRHVTANTAVSDRGALPPETIAKLRKHRWVRNYYS